MYVGVDLILLECSCSIGNNNDQTNNTRLLHNVEQNSSLQSGNLGVAANT
jgi:hypothetical protein